MLEQIILGIIQGIAEWLPVSSEGLIVLTKTNFFNDKQCIDTIIHHALFLHFGTFLAALIYFRKDVVQLVSALFRFKSQPAETQRLISFLFISTLISGVLGFSLIKILSCFTAEFTSAGKFITLVIGILLLGTAFLELKANKSGHKDLKDLKFIDGVILGIAQGFAALPGLSRSGLTVSTLLLRKFDKTYALKLSFLMSLPIVLAGNIILNLDYLQWGTDQLIGLAFSFIFGLGTIHLLFKLAQKINFGYFILLFAILTLFSALV